jgi:hypothetical protein
MSRGEVLFSIRKMPGSGCKQGGLNVLYSHPVKRIQRGYLLSIGVKKDSVP